MALIARIKQRYGFIEVSSYSAERAVLIRITDDNGNVSPNRAEIAPAQAETLETAIRAARKEACA